MNNPNIDPFFPKEDDKRSRNEGFKELENIEEQAVRMDSGEMTDIQTKIYWLHPIKTEVELIDTKIKGVITAVCIRDQSLVYEITYFQNSSYQITWFNDFMFKILDDKKEKLGYVKN